MRDYSDHSDVLKALSEDQQAERDLREEIAEVIAFQHHPQGQWEPEIWNEYEGRPRYTFDQTKPQVSKIWSEMAANDYSASTQPTGGGASEDVSNTIDGLIRNIHNVSGFDDISTKSGKRMIATGFSGWRVVSQYVGESFHQDLHILPINNIHERVWFDAHSEMQTREDAQHVFVLSALGKSECKDKWPNRSEEGFESLPTDLSSETYSHKPENIVVVGEIIYKKPYKKTIYLVDDATQSVVDDEGLAALEMTPDHPLVADSRECDSFKVYSRKLDNHGWLEDEKLTVFKHLPVIPEYANFDVVENKVTYEGAVRPIMDQQRVFNYSESRKVEESILAPRKKIFLDDRLAQGRISEFSRLNRNPSAVQLYKGDVKDAHPPTELGGINPSPALSELSQDMIRDIELSTGLPNNLTALQATTQDTDFRFNERESMGQLGTFEFYRAHKVALEHTAKVILGGIPKVYDTKRMVRIIGEDGQSSEIMINDRVGDQIQNNLTLGNYDITIRVGPSFKDRQTEANTRLLEMGKEVPGLIELNADVLINNVDAPGMRTVSDRVRKRLFEAGAIPQEQLTDQEIQQIQASANQPQPPDPAVLIAQAETEKAQAETAREQTRLEEARIKLQLEQQKQMSEQQKDQVDSELKVAKQRMEEQAQQIKNLGELVKTLKTYREAMGADAVVSESAAEGFEQQTELIDEQQENM